MTVELRLPAASKITSIGALPLRACVRACLVLVIRVRVIG